MQQAQAALSSLGRFLFFPLTTLLSVVGGLLVWFGFFLIGLIALRYETTFGRKTNGHYLLLAPSGILVYAIWQGLAYVTRGSLTLAEQWVNYALVLVSGVLCLRGAYVFRKTAEQIMKGAE